MGDELFNRKSDMENLSKIPAMEEKLIGFKESFEEFKEGWKDFKSDIKPCINDYPVIKEKLETHLKNHYSFTYIAAIPAVIAIVVVAIEVIFRVR